MTSAAEPNNGIISETTGAYITSIHQSYIESAAVLSLYMLSSGTNGKGITFTGAFRYFFRDFYRLYNVTADIQILPATLDLKNRIEEWFTASKYVLDRLKTDRKSVYDHAETGIKLGKEWITLLYKKQIIQTLR